jgi:hypothetical protein
MLVWQVLHLQCEQNSQVFHQIPGLQLSAFFSSRVAILIRRRISGPSGVQGSRYAMEMAGHSWARLSSFLSELTYSLTNGDRISGAPEREAAPVQARSGDRAA